MQIKRYVIIFILIPTLALIGTSCAYEYKAQYISAQLFEKVKRSAPKGAERRQVSLALQREGLPYFYSAPSNKFYGPQIPVGRFKLFWETQFFYEIQFNEADKVISFRTQLFNEGL